jgi:hypothetical protein
MQTLKFQLPNGTVVEISGDHETDIIKQAAFWSDLPTACPICGAGLRFGYSTPKTFRYFQLICYGDAAGVRHSVNLGEKQGSHDLYFDREKNWVKYIPGTPGEPLAGLPAAGESSAAAGNAGSDVARSGDSKINGATERNRVVGVVKHLIDVAKSNGIRPAVDYSQLAKMSVPELEDAGRSMMSTFEGAGIRWQ